MKEPINWPKAFYYTPTSIPLGISLNFLRHVLAGKNREWISERIASGTVHPALRIERITKELRYKGPTPHPLADTSVFPGHPQHGVFALANIPKDTELGEYAGEISFGRLLEKPAVFKGVHCWKVHFHELILTVSSANFANELAFINDFRSLSGAPNVRAKWILHQGSYYFGYETTREIEPEEELLADYENLWEKTRGAK